jgi:membrane protease YdiL (CAAX protease family)
VNDKRHSILSACELTLGAFIVIGHNVFRILPNEVPILFVLGMISIRLRDGSWSAMGLKRPESWLRVLLIALGAAALRIVLGYVVEWLAAMVWPPIVAPAGAEEIAGNLKTALLYFSLVWTFAAFGEEISYRGYLLTRAADLGNRSTISYWIGVVLISILFGYGHFYKGPAAFWTRVSPG